MRACLFLVVVGVITSSFSVAALADARADEAQPCAEVHQARGVVKGFGAERRSVTIAHEAIPGFMAAMTMSFDAATPEQLRAIAVGDRVRFTFTVTGDGKRVLGSIDREPSPR